VHQYSLSLVVCGMTYRHSLGLATLGFCEEIAIAKLSGGLFNAKSHGLGELGDVLAASYERHPQTSGHLFHPTRFFHGFWTKLMVEVRYDDLETQAHEHIQQADTIWPARYAYY